MPKKKTNVEVPALVYDLELKLGDGEIVKACSVVPFGDFRVAVDTVVEATFKNGYSSADFPYIYFSSLYSLFTDFPAADVESDDVMRETYIYHLDRELYNASAMAFAFKQAVHDGIEYRKNRSSVDVFFEKLNTIDIGKLEGVIKNLSSAKIDKNEITKAIVEAAKR